MDLLDLLIIFLMVSLLIGWYYLKLRSLATKLNELSSLSNQYQVEKNELRKKITDFIINT